MASILVLTSYPIFNNNYTIGGFPTSLGLLFPPWNLFTIKRRNIQNHFPEKIYHQGCSM